MLCDTYRKSFHEHLSTDLDGQMKVPYLVANTIVGGGGERLHLCPTRRLPSTSAPFSSRGAHPTLPASLIITLVNVVAKRAGAAAKGGGALLQMKRVL